jgi:DNA-binding NarL/FixJ family response regulator
MQSNANPINSQPNEPDQPAIHTLFINGINIVVLDYHDLYLVGFVAFLQLIGFNVTGKARKGTELLNLLGTNELPDIAIINYKTTQPQTLNVAKLVRDKYPNVKIVINTQYLSLSLLNELNKVGIDGLILKTEYSKQQIIEVLQAVYNGNKAL